MIEVQLTEQEVEILKTHLELDLGDKFLSNTSRLIINNILKKINEKIQ